MNTCKKCGKVIDDKYEFCWKCYQKVEKETKQRLEMFTCANCHKTMYSMKWPKNQCCSCYSHSQSVKNNKMCAKKESEFLTIETNNFKGGIYKT